MKFDREELKKIIISEQWVKVDTLISSYTEIPEKDLAYVKFNHWKAALKSCDYEKANILLDDALNFFPNNATLNRAKGDFYYDKEDYSKAEKYFKAALNIDNKNPIFWLKLGEAYYKNNKKNDALKCIRKSVSNGIKKDLSSTINEIERQIRSTKNEASDIYYDEVYAESTKYKVSGTDSSLMKVWLPLIKIISKQNFGHILDLGCGPGQFAEVVKSNLPEISYTGIDFSKEAIAQAKKRCVGYKFDQKKLPLKKYDKYQPFDVIVCTEVLEHIEKDRELLKSLPFDIPILLTVPNFNSFGHLRTFKSEDDIKNRYSSILEKIEIKKMKTSSKNIIWLVKSIRKKTLLDRLCKYFCFN